MNIYKLEQSQNNDYETYDSAIVAAPNEAFARLMVPGYDTQEQWKDYWERAEKTQEAPYPDVWAGAPECVQVSFLGVAAPGTTQSILLASFNAG